MITFSAPRNGIVDHGGLGEWHPRVRSAAHHQGRYLDVLQDWCLVHVPDRRAAADVAIDRRGGNGRHDVSHDRWLGLAKPGREPALHHGGHEGCEAVGARGFEAVIPHLWRPHHRQRTEDRQARQAVRIGDGEQLTDHAAERGTDEMHAIYTECIKQAAGVGRQTLHRIGRWRELGPAVSPVIETQNTIAVGQRRHLPVPH